MIVVVRPAEAARYWHVFEPMFETVTKETRGCYATVDVLREILNGQQVMWAVWDKERGTIDAVMTTAIINHPGRRTCRIVYVAGERMGEWLTEFREKVEQYAKEQGATALEGNFRRGWLRVWPGAEEAGVNLFKELGT